MDVVRIRNDLNEKGFSVMQFPKSLKTLMIDYIKNYINKVAISKSSGQPFEYKNNYEVISSIILGMSDKDYLFHFSKPLRMFPEQISHAVVEWIKKELTHVLGVKHVDSNFVSSAERKLNKKLSPNTYDIFWRCIRRHKNDVGPAHCDYQFWELAKGTAQEVSVPFAYRERWKIWVPLVDCVKDNMLQMIPCSHKETVPMEVIDTPFGKRPWLENTWYEKNKNRFMAPDANLEEDCILFHDKLIHRGPKNNYSNLRISSELII